MARQFMVLKVHMRCGKCRTKALMIAAATYRVTSVRLEGEDLEQLVVEGHQVEIDKLVRKLKKKVGYTQILYVYNR
ncbi:hypothetical protein AALP_AA6G100000 [Arabis alpina]|uniref:HMA domain-containing protein n=1 Tax=Arabis alpina TaxID=50452 RepID=A0A087GN91_ARAAL|nr:hypothetical protein AALP_AA6G100000 [Arabis alpina]